MVKKNILYIAPALPVGGAEKFLVLLTNSLVGDTATQTVISLSTDNILQTEFTPDIRIMPLPRLYKFDLNPAKTLRQFIKRERPDIIFCLNFFSYFFFRLATAGLQLKTNIIISYHSTIHVSKKEHFLHKFFSLLLSKNDNIITVSKNQAHYTANKYHISSKKIKTIYNGIDTMKWSLPNADYTNIEIRKQCGIPEKASVIIMTAAFRPEKNHAGAVKSLNLLHSKYNCEAYLLFVGNGIMFEQIKKLVIQLNLQEYVKFMGAQKDVRPFYQASNIFTLCSTSVETFSIAALEAMACGLPAVLTNIGGANEMIVDGLNGFLCEPNETDIALKWFTALRTNFSATTIHDYINTNFSASKMIDEYKHTLQIQNSN